MIKKSLAAWIGLGIALVYLWGGYWFGKRSVECPDSKYNFTSRVEAGVPYSEQRIAVAKVLGREGSCSKKMGLKDIQDIIDISSKEGVRPTLVAATIAVESRCDPLAVSSRGALGLMQVRPGVWKDNYDFSTKFNLFNPKDNITVGSRILAGLIKKHGITEGVRRYQGTGKECPTCDDRYTDKILKLEAYAAPPEENYAIFSSTGWEESAITATATVKKAPAVTWATVPKKDKDKQ